jgi:putative peptidoglycan lipid II flippase
VLSATLERDGRPALWALFSRVANLVFLITAGLAILVGVLAVPLVHSELGVAPGFSAVQQALVVNLAANLLALYLLATQHRRCRAAVEQTLLLPRRHRYDLGQIFGVGVACHPVSVGPVTLPAAGLGVYGLVYGVILGAILHLGVQIPGLIRYRFHWTPSLDIHDPGVLRVARLMGPRILTIGAFNLIFLIQDNLASRLAVGR